MKIRTRLHSMGTAPGKPIGRGAAAALVAVMAFATAAQADPPNPAEPAHAKPTVGNKTGDTQPAPKPLLTSQKKPTPKPQPDGVGIDIVGGSPAALGEFPYFVSLQSSAGGTGDPFCGASLMSTTKVLTAAHCVDGSITAADLQVTIGGTSLTPNNGVVRNISAIAIHPSWDSTTHQNDAAILTLASPIVRTDFSVQWLRLARGNELGLVDPGDPSVTIGHGSVCSGCVGSNQLLKVTVPIQSDATMTGAYGSSFHPATMVGAGPLGGGQDSCQGDSGGPLLITSTPQDIQIGNVSWGFGCAQAGFPGVYGELYQGALATFVNGQVSRPLNDQFTAATNLLGNGGSVVGNNENATMDPGEPFGETTVWYNWTPTVSGNAKVTVNQHGFDSEIHVFTGASVSALSLVAMNDDANGSLQSEVGFFAVAGTTYRLRVDGFGFDYGPFRLSYGVSRPSNDDFATAQPLATAVGSQWASNTNATGNAGEPSPGFGWADATLWYAWTAPETGLARLSTFGSNFDTVVAAYTGVSLPSLALVASNDDFNGTLQSLVSFPVTAGQVYQIQVGGFGGRRGVFQLMFTINPEANDMFSAAQVLIGPISPWFGSAVGSNLRAIAEPGEPAALGPDTSVWYRWVAPSSGTVEFRTCGSNFDTVLAVYTGSFITGLTQVAANDDSACGLQSIITIGITGNQTFFISVDGYGAARGNVTISFNVTLVIGP